MTSIQSIGETLQLKQNKFSIEKVNEYQEQLKLNQVALDYLKNERGFNDETISNFKLGYDPVKNAIVIPLFKNGECVAIKLRHIEPVDDQRYTTVKGGQNWIYNEIGIEHAKKRGVIMIVEGEFDCMSAWQSGVRNVVSPASGKDSYGVWIEQLDTIPKIVIAYDNDEGGRLASIKMAERLGTEKCFEVIYPENIKDTNDYFKKYHVEQFRELAKNAKPFYKYDYKGLGDIINSLRTNVEETITMRVVPNVKFEKDWICMVSGVSNTGKTSYVLNMADELTRKGIPTLIMPFERGIESVGKRFLQVKFNKSTEDFGYLESKDWDEVVKDCVDLPVYFTLPKRTDIISTLVRSKRLFDTRVCIIDHLDYIIRNVSGNKEQEIANTLQALKRVAEENKILLIIVTHVRKVEHNQGMLKRKPTMEDLKGSSSLYQDPEVVVMITRPDEENVEVNVLKNKGDMKGGTFKFDYKTGRLGERTDTFELPDNTTKI